jgi:hypothetical protein
MRRPSAGAILLGLVPFAAMCFSVSAWDRVYPMVLGLPFNLFWLLLWIVLTSVCMWGAYRIELSREAGEAPFAREQDPPE